MESKVWMCFGASLTGFNALVRSKVVNASRAEVGFECVLFWMPWHGSEDSGGSNNSPSAEGQLGRWEP